MNQSTLYLTDLDGTLLTSAGTLSDTTRDTINQLIASRGLQLSYATARSFESAHALVRGLDIRLPVAVYGGALIVDSPSGVVLTQHSLTADVVAAVLTICRVQQLQPLVYDFRAGSDVVMWLRGEESPGIRNYLSSRSGDRRLRPVDNWDELAGEAPFYITIIGTQAAIEPAARAVSEALAGRASIVVQRDSYCPEEYWLEISAIEANKGTAVTELKRRAHAQRVVCFGDNNNDLPMFALADASLAVSNACDALRDAASATIGSNDMDAVAHHLTLLC